MSAQSKKIQEVQAACELAAKSAGNIRGLVGSMNAFGQAFFEPFFLDAESGLPRTDLGFDVDDLMAATAVLSELLPILEPNYVLLAKVAS